MSRALVRLVGGESSGDEVWHDPDKQGPVIKMIKHPEFLVCPECRPDDPINPADLVMHFEEYMIHRINFDSGHFHFYAAPVRWRLVDLMNHLWHGFMTSEDK